MALLPISCEISAIAEAAEETAHDGQAAFGHAGRESVGVSSGSHDAPAVASPYAYRSTAPISALEPGQVSGVVSQFEKSVSRYATDNNGNRVVAPPQSSTFEDDSMTADRWTDRSREAEVVSIMATQTSAPESNMHVYMLGEQHPVAIARLKIRAGRRVEIEHLATHPGVQQAGTTMVEYAVNESQLNGTNGRLKLLDLRGTEGFYHALGFEEKGEDDFIYLNPSKCPEKWTKNRDTQTWSFNKLDRRGYLTEDK